MGSNNAQTKHRVLKIDRTEPRDLVIIDDKVSILMTVYCIDESFLLPSTFILLSRILCSKNSTNSKPLKKVAKSSIFGCNNYRKGCKIIDPKSISAPDLKLILTQSIDLHYFIIRRCSGPCSGPQQWQPGGPVISNS